ncbi:hypothetical protein TH61_10380 [Rufibacter sp. DG15C]|uniref:hypothetical protein n=1 Tax=Rufibacter sp. DG15C TaxID=1379909 RepID=UPI00078C3368|nr:hypothetical protein [Rufibacter sp. DG15C]AMM51497.1 hypothetical protein TH61_10380 [Rufibacter sp. DG15C]
MSDTKKCPHCQHWSAWHQQVTDRCAHCQSLLDPKAYQRLLDQDTRQEAEKNQFNVVLIEILPTDSAFTKFWKRIVQGFQLTFMAILSFILWLIALLAG